MGGNRTWTADELDYLAEKWGVIRPAKIGEKLGRSEGAVVQKASKLGLGPFLEAGGYVSLNQLLIAVTGTNAAYSYKMKSWSRTAGCLYIPNATGKTAGESSTSMSSGNGQRRTRRFWISQRWNRWRWEQSRIG